METRPHIFGLDRETLRGLVKDWGLPAFRADQVLEWIFARHTADPQRMSNLSKADRAAIADKLQFTTGTIVRHQVATDGVQKLLIGWEPQQTADPVQANPSLTVLNAPEPPSACPPSDDASDDRATPADPAASLPQTECVMIPADESNPRKTACISSQVGCPVGCRFCASGLGGLEGNLTAGRIVEQVWRLGTLPGVQRITHVVFMGMGEPLANFDQVTQAARLMTAPWGLGISARRITISTVGLPAQIRRLAELDLPLTLAISLHAPNDQIRRQLIPWAQYVTIQQILEAGQYYFEKTGREITLEYILLRGVNDQAPHARELAQVAKTLRSNVNLIRYNEVRGMPYSRPDTNDVRRFQEILRGAGVNVHIRASRGRDIAAACGQLRHEHQTTG